MGRFQQELKLQQSRHALGKFQTLEWLEIRDRCTDASKEQWGAILAYKIYHLGVGEWLCPHRVCDSPKVAFRWHFPFR